MVDVVTAAPAPAAPAAETPIVTAPVVVEPSVATVAAEPVPAATPEATTSEGAKSELFTPAEAPVTVLESTEADGGAIEYEPTGDPAFDVSLNFLGSLGFAGDSDAMIRAAKGDFALLEAQLATMGAKAAGWERMVALAKSAYATSEGKRAEVVKATEGAIISVVGNKETWAAITKWAAENADPNEKAQINAMIDGGEVQARAAATLLLSAYQKAAGTKVNPAPAVRDAAGSVAVVNGPLNSKDYGTAVRELHAKLGSRMETSQEYADLQRRLR